MSLLVLLIAVFGINVAYSQTVNCNNNFDCSYNGVCKNSVCECFPQWIGGHCGMIYYIECILNILIL